MCKLPLEPGRERAKGEWIVVDGLRGEETKLEDNERDGCERKD
jgi:hypothetical protein